MKLADLATPSFVADPYPVFEALRAEGPLVPIGTDSMISGHYDIVDKVLHDRRMVHNFENSVRVRYGEEGARQPVLRGFSRMFLLMNPPVHTRLRGLMMKAFNARQIETLRDIAQASAQRLIDRFESGGTADIMSVYAKQFPIEIICRMLNVPVEHAEKLGRAIAHVAKMLDTAPVDAAQLATSNDAYLTLERYFSEVVEARREQTGTDLISMLLTVEENGDTLTHDEIVANVILLYLGGHETTSNMIGNALIALQRHPQQFDALKQDMTKLPNAILECLRYDGSAQASGRTASEDMEIAGIAVPKNTIVYLSLGAANRDPAKFDRPDQLDIDRELTRVITFGGGVHHCLGYRLAMLELETALGVLLTRLPRLTLSGLDNLQWNGRSSLRGVESLTAHW
ncbi:cytochrome P450 [Paraburkholderia solisilvae]|uniref:Vitamin D(3) 25-hydroxylase n=1 Tax=Paraburkholderia solisilvae TaxID=624376 RepID=A0A6J5E4R3_9BURK|nr:cytochrome P450 [Paraburkholderia solisilvae]CAB3760082.1 Vitamin D(3) 25-hydroxylase [Paraburkholderia solisilvae]